MTTNYQFELPGVESFLLKQKVAESLAVVNEAVARSEKLLIVQFSGGRDSCVVLHLVRQVTNNFICCYNTTGIEFPSAIEFAGSIARKMDAGIVFSNPSLYKGGFFERLAQFRKWPGMRTTWCQRDLKSRSAKRLLVELYGKGSYYKLLGVRRFESIRRHAMYRPNVFFRRDGDCSGDYLVYPILNWSNKDVVRYLQLRGLPSSSLYKKYGVSGCYWCPFYEPEIYRRVLAKEPNRYDEFIKWEGELGQPSVKGHIYLRDLKIGMVNASD